MLQQVILFPGPSDWPGMCQSGSRQSPIDLDPETTVPGRFMPLVLLNYDRKLKANVTNNGHTGKSECRLKHAGPHWVLYDLRFS
jgi:carbonic anhydrase